MPVIKAVAFDIGGVLEIVDDAAWPVEWQRHWADTFGIDESAWHHSMARFDHSGLSVGTLTDSDWKRTYQLGLGLTAEQVELMVADLWDRYCGRLNTELMSYARSLRPKYRLGIISNSGDGARREEERRYHFSVVFDPIIYSHEVGLAKPDPRIWALACQRIGVAPAELVFIDDGAEACDSARAFGINAVHHRSTTQSIAALTSLLE